MYEVGQIYKTSGPPKTDAEKEVKNNIDWEGIIGNVLNNLPETIAAVKGNNFLPPQPPPPPQRTGLDFFKSNNFIMLAFVVLILVYFLSTTK